MVSGKSGYTTFMRSGCEKQASPMSAIKRCRPLRVLSYSLFFLAFLCRLNLALSFAASRLFLPGDSLASHALLNGNFGCGALEASINKPSCASGCGDGELSYASGHDTSFRGNWYCGLGWGTSENNDPFWSQRYPKLTLLWWRMSDSHGVKLDVGGRVLPGVLPISYQWTWSCFSSVLRLDSVRVERRGICL